MLLLSDLPFDGLCLYYLITNNSVGLQKLQQTTNSLIFDIHNLLASKVDPWAFHLPVVIIHLRHLVIEDPQLSLQNMQKPGQRLWKGLLGRLQSKLYNSTRGSISMAYTFSWQDRTARAYS